MVNKATITQFECDCARRKIGYHICPKENMKHKDPTADTEYSVKYTLAINWAISTNAVNLTRQESHMAYHGVLQA